VALQYNRDRPDPVTAGSSAPQCPHRRGPASSSAVAVSASTSVIPSPEACRQMAGTKRSRVDHQPAGRVAAGLDGEPAAGDPPF